MEMTFSSSKIAENIKALRLKNNLTQLEMAEVLGYSERQVRRLETEGTFSLQVINLISTAFKVSAWDILGDRMS